MHFCIIVLLHYCMLLFLQLLCDVFCTLVIVFCVNCFVNGLLLNLCIVRYFWLCVILCSFICDVDIVCCILYIYGVHCMLFISCGVLYCVKERYALHFFVIFKSFGVWSWCVFFIPWYLFFTCLMLPFVFCILYLRVVCHKLFVTCLSF